MYDQDHDIQVRGDGVVVTGGAFDRTTLTWIEERSIGTFLQVPAGRKLIITDFVLFPQGDCTTRHTINFGESTGSDFLQLVVSPGVHTDSHFLTGFVIAPGSTVLAWSDAAAPQGQHVTLVLNGYLAAAPKPRARGKT